MTRLCLLAALATLAAPASAQVAGSSGATDLQYTNDLQYFRPPGQAGLTMFEVPKRSSAMSDGIEIEPFDGLKVHVGGDFAIQFQGLSQGNDMGNLVNLAPNFALPTANLNLDVQIADGMRMNLRTYLSSRHHTEAYVKGGYFQVDNLDFVQEDFLSGLMDVTRFRFGMDQINYGDAHFRRSDNADVMHNPFVGNYLMDSFTTEPFAEATVLSNGLIGVAGVSNGRLNQSPLSGDNGVAVFGKLGVDRQVTEALRARLTGSVYHSTDGGTRDYIYGGDRAGARYYNVLEVVDEARPSDFLPRFNPGFPHQTAFQINPFVQVEVNESVGVELFGLFERSLGGGEAEVAGVMTNRGAFTQLGGELLLRLGSGRDFYLGGRYNTVNGSAMEDGPDQDIQRFNVGGGWFMTDNVLAKAEYVSQSYDGDGFVGDAKFQGAEFSGVVVEAAISF